MNFVKTVITFSMLCFIACSCIAQEVSSQQLLPPEGILGFFTDESETNGETLLLYGQVLDVQGQAVSGASVEIWQTDTNGAYDHPRDPSTAERDMSFQFYGSSQTDTSGWYIFRTILPGKYEPRPRHIHFKVKLDNNTLLTSQFYFSEDIVDVQREGMFGAVSENSDALLLQLVMTDDENEKRLVANGQIIVSVSGRSGELSLTPSQGEGPYYPVVAVADFDNDLTILE